MVLPLSPPLSLLSAIPTIVGNFRFTRNNPEEGKTTIATCSWTGEPNPTVQWLKDGVVLVESELRGHIRISPLVNGMGSNLEISSVRMKDAGDYMCNITNSVGSDFRVKSLTVRGRCA